MALLANGNGGVGESTRASLQKPNDQQIMHSCSNGQRISLLQFSDTAKYEVVKQGLQNRFQNSCTIPGTRKLHAFIPLNRHLLAVKLYSNFGEHKEKVVKNEGELGL